MAGTLEALLREKFGLKNPEVNKQTLCRELVQIWSSDHSLEKLIS
jgi:hypothetical protein